jgi:hypothetical protein
VVIVGWISVLSRGLGPDGRYAGSSPGGKNCTYKIAAKYDLHSWKNNWREFKLPDFYFFTPYSFAGIVASDQRYSGEEYLSNWMYPVIIPGIVGEVCVRDDR